MRDAKLSMAELDRLTRREAELQRWLNDLAKTSRDIEDQLKKCRQMQKHLIESWAAQQDENEVGQ